MTSELLSRSEAEQERHGYLYTLREIRQQPATFLDTCERMLRRAEDLKRCLQNVQSVVFTGSGSSEYVGDCVRPAIQRHLKVTCQAIGSGMVLTYGSRALPPLRPSLMVSLARSGDSPESVGAVQLLMSREPEVRHLVVTCNSKGKLATRYDNDPRVTVVSLDDRTNDRSLVMTSSFTNMLVAAWALGFLDAPEAYSSLCRQLSSISENVIGAGFDALSSVGRREFRRAVFLASGSGFGAAREAALKMLEMTAGRVSTLCETYLGLRHGPMSYIDRDSLIVCFLSSEPKVRVYETDLLRELDRKKLGLLKLIAGENVPRDVLRENDVAIDCPGLGTLGDDNACVVHVVVGQLLAFFRCLQEGLRPDSPSEGGVINRVVENFQLHIEGDADLEDPHCR
ncbi:MAG: SIS domain-containing protein [Bryobacteraceae bacterium]